MYVGRITGVSLSATQRTRYVDAHTSPDSSSKVMVTTSKPSAFPSTLRMKLRSDVREVSEAEKQIDASIKETCAKCGCEEVRYYTQQLRSADEGSTVFYTCPQCGNKWNTNN